MVLLKKFSIALAIGLYSVVPVFAGDSDRVPSHCAKERLRIGFQTSLGGEGLISHYKREYQIAVGQSHPRHQRHGMGGRKCSGMRWDKGAGKNWGQGYVKNSNKRHGMGGRKCSGKRGDRSPGDKWQNYGKKKSFESD